MITYLFSQALAIEPTSELFVVILETGGHSADFKSSSTAAAAAAATTTTTTAATVAINNTPLSVLGN